MNDDPRDPILDACLEEVLGEIQPPDLTHRILQAWHSARRQEKDAGRCTDRDIPVPTAGPAPIESEPIPPPIQVLGGSGPAAVFSSSAAPTRDGSAPRPAASPASWPPAPTSRRAAASRLQKRRRRHWSGPVIAASLIAVATLLSVWIVSSELQRPERPAVARNAPGSAGQSASGERSERSAGNPPPRRRAPENARDGGSSSSDEPSTAAGQPGLASDQSEATDAPRRPGDEPDPFGQELPFARSGSDPPAAGTGSLADETPEMAPWDDAQVVAFVNGQLRDAWQQYGVRPAEPASDEKWCRRLYLRLLGRIPTVPELRQFAEDTSDNKRERLVERLLEDSEYVSQWADHWAGIWTNVLVGRTGGTQPNQPGDREQLHAWLRDALADNRPFDQLAFDLIAASGSTQPEDSDYNPAVHFLLTNLNEKATLATTRTSRAFLGKQLQCTQCHQHPSNSWAQRQFWELNAFFRQLHMERDDAAGHYRLVNRDFPGESGRDPREAEVYFEQLNGKLQAAYPVFLDRHRLSPSGLLEDVDRRRELARLVAESDDLNRAVVNRIWMHFLGHAFTPAVDDMGPHSAPSHPELLQTLAGQFDAHGHDLKSLMRWVVRSEAFGLSSRVPADEQQLVDRPDAGSVPLFSRYYTRQLPPEEVFQSLQLVASARKNGTAGGGVESPIQARQDWLGQFARNMDTDEGTEINSFDGDIRQSVIIMNGPLMRQATSLGGGTVLRQVLDSTMNLEEKVEHLFLAALARKPNRQEFAVIHRMLQQSGDERTVLQDIWWALLNSNEFILDH